MVDFRTLKERYIDNIRLEIWPKDNPEVSLPMPCRNKGGEIEEAFFITKNGEAEPYAWFKIESEYGKVRVYADRRDLDFHDGYTEEVKNGKDYNKDHYRRLVELYKSIREFVFKDNLSREDKNKVIEYRRLFKTGTKRELRMYYHSIGKEFFDWMDETCKNI